MDRGRGSATTMANLVCRDYASLARDVSYAFDMRDSQLKDIEVVYEMDGIQDELERGEITRQEAIIQLHDCKTERLEFEWVERIEAIKYMTLDRLQLSFEDCYCSNGCCRKVDWVLDGFVYDDVPPGRTEADVFCDKPWRIRPPLVIEVFGWRNEKEKTMIQKKLDQLRGSKCNIEIHLLDPRRYEEDYYSP